MAVVFPAESTSKKRTKRILGILFVFLTIVGCTSPEERDLKRGNAEVKKGHSRTSITYFERVLKRNPSSPVALQAAREGARVSVFELKDFKKALGFYRHLILYSQDAKEREQAQKDLANVAFDNLNDYEMAAAEYSKLLGLNLPFAEKAKFQIALGRSYFYLGRFEQSESEIDALLKERLQESTRFSALTLKGNILVSKKLFGEAAEIYRQVLKEFPEKSKEENVALQLAVCYEENHDFRSAIQILESTKSDASNLDYVELRIKRLQERLRNQPGARGFRK
ncbi:MAG TPA: tetratricopeptide repeat protein [Pseudobdellovibrionaceae bacterium]|nr:tetratricopeptide repeat protein [Pseudobdellovibrionaceae bacterium]